MAAHAEIKIDKLQGLPVKFAPLFALTIWWVDAEVVKLVYTPASGAGGGNPVEVQVLSSAPFVLNALDLSQSVNHL